MKKKGRMRIVLAPKVGIKLSMRKLVVPCTLLILIFTLIFLYFNLGKSNYSLADVEFKTGSNSLVTSVTLVSASRIELSWTTTLESNNDYFTIERSQNGIDYFEIGKTQGCGNSILENAYHFTDNTELKGEVFYKISQTDYNGTTVTFTPFPVNFSDSTDNSSQIKYAGISAFNENINIEFHSPEQGVVELRLLNSKGKLIRSEQEITMNGLNTFSFMDVKSLEKGFYFVQLIEEDIELPPVKVEKY